MKLVRRPMVPLKRAINTIARPPLAFMDTAANPLSPPKGNAEQKVEQTATELQLAFRKRAKEEQVRFAETTKTDFYGVVVFEHGSQLNSFLQQVGYPDPAALFIDGTILAECLKLRLPPSPFKLKKLRPPDRTLLRLTAGTLKRQ